MKSIRSFSLFIIMSFIVVSCGIEKSFLQKRKYNKGYYVSIAKKNKKIDVHSSSKEKLNDAKEIKVESAFLEKENCNSPNNEKILVQHEISNDKKDKSSNINRKSKTDNFNNSIAAYKSLSHKFKGINIYKKTNNNTTSVRPNSKLDDDLINLILAIVLVIAIIMLLSFLDGLLGGLLSLILLIVIVVLLLSYFGII